jgi:hypothetical protein
MIHHDLSHWPLVVTTARGTMALDEHATAVVLPGHLDRASRPG